MSNGWQLKKKMQCRLLEPELAKIIFYLNKNPDRKILDELLFILNVIIGKDNYTLEFNSGLIQVGIEETNSCKTTKKEEGF